MSDASEKPKARSEFDNVDRLRERQWEKKDDRARKLDATEIKTNPEGYRRRHGGEPLHPEVEKQLARSREQHAKPLDAGKPGGHEPRPETGQGQREGARDMPKAASAPTDKAKAGPTDHPKPGPTDHPKSAPPADLTGKARSGTAGEREPQRPEVKEGLHPVGQGERSEQQSSRGRR